MIKSQPCFSFLLKSPRKLIQSSVGFPNSQDEPLTTLPWGLFPQKVSHCQRTFPSMMVDGPIFYLLLYLQRDSKPPSHAWFFTSIYSAWPDSRQNSSLFLHPKIFPSSTSSQPHPSGPSNFLFLWQEAST